MRLVESSTGLQVPGERSRSRAVPREPRGSRQTEALLAVCRLMCSHSKDSLVPLFTYIEAG